MTISPTLLQIDEGTSASYTVRLDSAPEGTVSVSVEVLPFVLIAVFPLPTDLRRNRLDHEPVIFPQQLE